MTDWTEIKGATAGSDLSGLIREELKTRELRDLAETEAIDHAYHKYILRGRPKKRGSEWLNDQFIRKVHFDMFGEIWDWAGKYRAMDLNIGVPAHEISEQVGTLCGDFHYWETGQSKMSTIEIAARLQNRLTRIHPFRNGNGRHARLMTDIFFKSHHHSLPLWPQIQRMEQGNKIREAYIISMKKADQENFAPLIQFITDCLEGGHEEKKGEKML